MYNLIIAISIIIYTMISLVQYVLFFCDLNDNMKEGGLPSSYNITYKKKWQFWLYLLVPGSFIIIEIFKWFWKRWFNPFALIFKVYKVYKQLG